MMKPRKKEEMEFTFSLTTVVGQGKICIASRILIYRIKLTISSTTSSIVKNGLRQLTGQITYSTQVRCNRFRQNVLIYLSCWNVLCCGQVRQIGRTAISY